MSKLSRRHALASSAALMLCFVAIVQATGFYVEREMSCDPGGVAPKASNNVSNFFDYIMECEPNSSDCSSKKLRVFLWADTEGADDATWVNFEVFWDDGTSTSQTMTYPGNGGDHIYYTSFHHEYAQNGTYHPTVISETALRTCTYSSETVVTP